MKLFEIKFKHIHESVVNISGPSEEAAIAALKEWVGDSLELFEVTEVTVLVEEFNEAQYQANTEQGVLN